MNSALKRLQQQENKHGRKSEKKTSKRFGARLRPGSGAMPGAKGDFVLPDFLFEAKATVNDSLGLKKAWLDKITGEALEIGREPALTVTFVDPNGAPLPRGTWVLVRESTLAALIEKAKE